MDRYRGRSPDPRYPPPSKDTYIPSSRAPRPRSRSPGGYRARSRTPPRPAIDSYRGGAQRRYEGGSDTYPPRARSPRREYASAPRYNGSPRDIRDRSPSAMHRGRELSPARGMHSTPVGKGDRYASPPRDFGRARSPPRQGYRPRSRSPLRSDRTDPYAAKSWRRRTPSPRGLRSDGRVGGGSGRNSMSTSRRSSPRPPPRGSELYPPEDFRGPHSAHRSPRPRSPPPREAPPPRQRSPYRETGVDPYATRPRAHAEDYDGYHSANFVRPTAEPAPPSDYRQRPPPTGPAGSYRDPHITPPTGPSAAPMSMSAHNRPGGNFASPTAPHLRGGRGGFRGRGFAPDYPARDRFGGAPADHEGFPLRTHGRGGWGDTPGYGRGGASRDFSAPYEAGGPPRRESFGFRGRGGAGGPGGNGTSFTTPRTQRFNQQIADVPKIKEGGEKLPALHDTTKADKLEEEAARLRKVIDEKEIKKRQGLREWDRLETETKMASLKSDLAEEHLRSLNGEESLGTAAF